MNGLARRHWIAALAVALLLHVGVAAAMVWPDEEVSGAAMPGLAGLEISLGAAGGSPGVAEPVSAPAVQNETVVDPVAPVESPQIETVEAESVTAEAVPVEVTEAEPVEVEPVEVEPVEAVEPVEVVEAVEEIPIETVVAEAVVEPVTEPAPLPEAKPAVPQAEPLPEAIQAEAVETETADTQATASAATTDPAGETGEDAETAPVGNAAPGAGAEVGESAGDNSPGGGTPGTVADYYALLQAWLEQHRRYPSRARSLRQEGVAYVYFVVDEQGRVLESRLERSSGYSLLDEEVLAMVARANPVPPIPADMNKTHLALVLPVAFTLK